jgi:enoyl-CoA hydratase
VGELMAALEEFDADEGIGAMVVTGSERAFAAGADIKEMAQASAVDMLLHDRISLFDRIREIQKPVVAAVSGWCLGGGNELALSCDMIVASETARFGQPEITIGVIPGAGGTQRLARAVGKALAWRWCSTTRTLNAVEAQRFGLVNRGCQWAFLEALVLAAEIARRAPLACAGQEAVNHAFDSFLSDGLADERRALLPVRSEDQKEAWLPS